MTGERTLVVWVPDWPVLAAGATAGEPVAIVFANRVVACSAAARDEGVRRGLRRRDAQGRCPRITVVGLDADRDARAFEPVVAAVADELTPRVEVLRPGTLALATRGPSRYFGGDEALAARAAALADAVLPPGGGVRSRAGVADGPFAASLAARRAVVVPPGETPAFLAPFGVGTLELPDFADLLKRLGLLTLGDLAALPEADVLARFGTEGVRAHRLARGLDDRPVQPAPPEPDLIVSIELDPPAERVETAAFVARSLAAELAERLGRRGLACTRVGIEAETEHGESLARLWRSDGGLGPGAVADRVRWQLDGWLNAGAWGDRPTSGITVLRLVPDQVVPDDGRQLGFWGGAAAADERAARGVARLQRLLGPDAVLVPERRGGRGPGEQVALVPAHTVALGRPAPERPGADQPPWPGRLPAPSPALVHAAPPAADVLDADGEAVGVTGRGLVTAEPVRVGSSPVVAWAGPWAADERWWDPASARRRARVQVVLADGTAHLLCLEAGRWTVEATYD